MFYVISLISAVFTYIIPLAVSLKALTLEGKTGPYKFLINYWIYYVGLQWIDSRWNRNDEMGFPVSFMLDMIKIWLFYGKPNNLRLLNDIILLNLFRRNAVTQHNFEDCVDLLLSTLVASDVTKGFLENYFHSLDGGAHKKKHEGLLDRRIPPNDTHNDAVGFISELIKALPAKEKKAPEPKENRVVRETETTKTPSPRTHLSPPSRGKSPLNSPSNKISALNLNVGQGRHPAKKKSNDDLPPVQELQQMYLGRSYAGSVISDRRSSVMDNSNEYSHGCFSDGEGDHYITHPFPHKGQPKSGYYIQPCTRSRSNSLPSEAGHPIEFKIDKKFFSNNKHKLFPGRA